MFNIAIANALKDSGFGNLVYSHDLDIVFRKLDVAKFLTLRYRDYKKTPREQMYDILVGNELVEEFWFLENYLKESRFYSLTRKDGHFNYEIIRKEEYQLEFKDSTKEPVFESELFVLFQDGIY